MRKNLALLVILGLLLVGPSQVIAESVREKLVKMENVEAVWALDKYYTVVYPRYNLFGKKNKFVVEFYGLLSSLGKVEISARAKDEFTDKVMDKWLPIEIKHGDDSFRHPIDGRKRIFIIEPEFHFRVNNVLTIDDYLFSTDTNSTGEPFRKTRKIFIRHSTPQPIIYKSELVKKMDLAVPKIGKFDFKPLSRGLKGVESGDIMQYLVLLAEKWGPGAWVIFRSGLEEVTAYEFYRYIATTNDERVNLFFYCQNPDHPFVLKAKNGDWKFFHRTMAGINYKPLGGSQDIVQTAVETLRNAPTKTEKMAMDAINTKSDATINPYPSELYRVLYHGFVDGCEAVTVQQYRSVQGKAQGDPIETFDYTFCHGHLKRLPTEFVSKLPQQVEVLVSEVSQKAQQDGQAKSTYINYSVVGKALRDQTKCTVRVRIFKGQKFIEERVVNGCVG